MVAISFPLDHIVLGFALYTMLGAEKRLYPELF